jgi:hypothetical protein
MIPVRNIGLPDRFVDQGERGELLAECGLDAEGVLRQLADWTAAKVSRRCPNADDAECYARELTADSIIQTGIAASHSVNRWERCEALILN